MENIAITLKHFGIKNNNFKCEQINTGHINDTFKIYSDNKAYILQKVNTDVFRYPEKVMQNIAIAQSCFKNNTTDGMFPVYLESKGKNFLLNNGFWRIYPYIESTSDHSDERATEGFGRLLGDFHRHTENVDISMLFDTLADFHNIEKKLLSVMNHPSSNQYNCKFYNEFYNYYKENKSVLSPKRLVHNDVKWSNVLINPKTLVPSALIDYDTVMAGYGAFDFGDAIRSICSDNGNKVSIKAIKEFSRGYFSVYKGICAEECTLGIIAVTAELSARYLFDCISNENYFKNLSYEQKLLKHESLLRLAEDMFNVKNDIKSAIFEEYLKNDTN